LLASPPNHKLEDHSLPAVRDCLFNIFSATLDIGFRSSIRNLRTRHAVVTGTHLSHRWKPAIKLNFQVQIYLWTELIIQLYLSFPTAQYTSPFKSFLKIIAVFTWPEAYTVALSQYTEFLKLDILYYPHKTTGILFKIFHFP
jgi:hypothetical protein